MQRVDHLIQHEAPGRAGAAAPRRAGAAAGGLPPLEAGAAVAGHEAGGVRLGGPPAQRTGAVLAPGVVHVHVQHPAALVRGALRSPNRRGGGISHLHIAVVKAMTRLCVPSSSQLAMPPDSPALYHATGLTRQTAAWQKGPKRQPSRCHAMKLFFTLSRLISVLCLPCYQTVSC